VNNKLTRIRGGSDLCVPQFSASSRVMTAIASLDERQLDQCKPMRRKIVDALTLRAQFILLFLLCALPFVQANAAFAQFLDQGAITGTVQDNTGAVIPGATVALESPDTGFKLTTTADASGMYVFSLIKIGHYTITASAPGFENAVQQNITLSQGQRLNVSPKLKPGAVTETVTVTDAPPLLQTEASSVGQALNSEEIVNTPLNGRNAVYLVQLTPGAAPGHGSRATSTGDFDANGLRPEQNNFVMDGVDNNSITVDFLSTTSYLINPPPDALAEFKVSTSDYSSEFGHSAGAVISSSIKSGSNAIHGDLWEYWRNDVLNAHDWTTPTLPTGEYRQNQFGATLGLPILRNKLFFFGDFQGNRIVINQSQSNISVPTLLERQGNFTELLTPALTGGSVPVNLYVPQNNQSLLACNGVQNVICPGQINTVAQNLLNLYPKPNANGGLTYNNYAYQLKQPADTFQWDTRVDWDISSKDQAFARFSYVNLRTYSPPPLGPVLDGSCGSGSTCVSGTTREFANNVVLSETHIFDSKLVNEARFALNYGHFNLTQPNSTANIAQTLGLGGVPFGPNTPGNGGVPYMTIGSINTLGTRNYRPEKETENEYQILDNVSWTLGKHSVRLGFSDQSIRSYTLEPPNSRPSYTFGGSMTAKPGVSNTGNGVADFLLDQMSGGSIGPFAAFNNAQNFISAYTQDDWKATKRLTFNLGVRYEFFQPYKEMNDLQANFYVTSAGIATGTGVYKFPAADRTKLSLTPAFTTFLAQENIALEYDPNSRLTSEQHLNFAPRIGFAYAQDSKSVLRGGFGIFYQGQQSVGAANDMGFNYPFVFSDNFPAPSCTTGSASCANNGYNLETGFSSAISQGLTSYFNIPTLVGQSPDMKTTYAMDYNLTLQRSITNNLVATVAYVGTASRHLPININSNSSKVLLASGSTQNYLPFPAIGSSANILYEGVSKYNALQTKLEKRMSHGVDFLATYTWSHAMDDAGDPLGGGIAGYRNPNIIPIGDDMSDAGWDVRQRFTFNGLYKFPFGRGQSFLSHDSRVVDALLGGWTSNLTYQLESGQPFAVGTANQSNVVGGSAYALRVGDPFAPGGTPDPTNPSITCPTSVRNKAHWFNPCAFRNPLPASLVTPIAKDNGNPTIPASGYAYPAYITDAPTAKLFLGDHNDTITGPGYQRLDMSMSKHFVTFREQYLEVRADGFNILNTPAYGSPNSGIGQSGGQITSARVVQSYTPNSRFFQLSAKYVF
jgi:hypothetical protein